jgi:glutathione S-transferase
MSSGALKLYYFNLHARAELIRFIFAAAARPWNDVRFEYKQWPEYKPKMLLGQCPVLELPDGTQIPQSLSIARYVARENGLAGNDNLESAKIDAVADTQRDLNDIFHTKVLFEKDEKKKAEELQTFRKRDLSKNVEHLMALKKAYSTDRKYFVGSNLSWADLFVYLSMQRIIKTAPQTKNLLDTHFKETFDTVNSDSNIKKYLDQRPSTPF